MNELGARGNLCTRLADYFGRFWGKVLGAWAAGPSGAALLATWHLALATCHLALAAYRLPRVLLELAVWLLRLATAR